MDEIRDVSYQYRKLESSKREIRVLVLQPSIRTDGNLRCHLEHATLNQATKYEALSYVWGQTDIGGYIRLDDSDFFVSKNLFLALHYLQYRFKSRALWVDAICINQNDIPERNSQVGIMGSIYSSATRTVVWLGPHSNDSQLAVWGMKVLYYQEQIRKLGIITQRLESRAAGVVVRLFLYLVSGCVILWLGLRQFLAGRMAYTTWKLSTDQSFFSRSAILQTQDEAKLLTQDMLASVEKMLQKSWFTRTWTAQEYVVAKDCTFLYGTMSISTSVFVGGTRGYRRKKYVSQLNAFPKMTLYTARQDRLKGDKVSLLELLDWFRDCEVSDPRDKIYGMLGMADDLNKVRIVVEYKHPVEKVFAEAIFAFIDGQKNLDCLGLHFPSLEFTSDLVIPNTPTTRDDNTITRESFVEGKEISQTVADISKRQRSYDLSNQLPSFAVDWTQRKIAPFEYLIQRPSKLAEGSVNEYTVPPLMSQKYAASGQTLAARSNSQNEPLLLSLKGFQFDSLNISATIAKQYMVDEPKTTNFYRIWTSILRWYDSFLSAQKIAGLTSHDTDITNAFLRTILADGSGEDKASQEALDYLASLLRPDFEDYLPRTIDDNLSVPINADHVVQACWGRSFYVTGSGNIGLGPCTIEVGDILVILYGGQTPYFLRPRDDGCFKFIGEAYSYDYMDGKAMDELRDGKWEERLFDIR